jgi:ankyrin repeat protein
LSKYFTRSELELYRNELTHIVYSDSSTNAIEDDPSTLHSAIWSPSVIKDSPFRQCYEPLVELSKQEIQDLEKNINKHTNAYQHFIDDIDIIFRMPINASTLKASGSASSSSIYMENILPASSSSSHSAARPVTAYIKESAMHKFIGGKERVADSDDDDDDGDDGDAHLQLPAAPTTATSSTFSSSSAATANNTTNIANNKKPVEPEDAEDIRKPINTASVGNQSSRITNKLFLNYYDKSSTNAAASAAGAGKESNARAKSSKLLSSPGSTWDMQLTAPLYDYNENYPEEDLDIIHVQFLSASNGSWLESVQLRKHFNISYNNDNILNYIENNVTPLHLASYYGNITILTELVAVGNVDVYGADNEGNTVLHYACKRGHLHIVQYLSEELNFSPYVENMNGIIPIQYALRFGYLEIVTYFMEHCPTLVLPTFHDSRLGGTLLHYACLSSSTELIQYLLYVQNIHIDSVTVNDSSTPLHWAAYASTKLIVEFLIEKCNADRSYCNKYGQTALHLATMSGDSEKTIYLIDVVGMKITDKDNNHKTPFDVAQGHAAVILLERKNKGFVTGSIADKHRNDSIVEKKKKQSSIYNERHSSISRSRNNSVANDGKARNSSLLLAAEGKPGSIYEKRSPSIIN